MLQCCVAGYCGYWGSLRVTIEDAGAAAALLPGMMDNSVRHGRSPLVSLKKISSTRSWQEQHSSNHQEKARILSRKKRHIASVRIVHMTERMFAKLLTAKDAATAVGGVGGSSCHLMPSSTPRGVGQKWRHFRHLKQINIHHHPNNLSLMMVPLSSLLAKATWHISISMQKQTWLWCSRLWWNTRYFLCHLLALKRTYRMSSWSGEATGTGTRIDELIKLGVSNAYDVDDEVITTSFPACQSGFKNKEITPLSGGYFTNGEVGYECMTANVLNLGVAPRNYSNVYHVFQNRLVLPLT